MAWTTFANLTTATTPQLDGNFAILTALAPIQCTVTGSTNALTLTPVNAATPLNTYQTGMQFTGVAIATNTGAATAGVVGFSGTFNIYKDTSGGPVALTGSEIINLCQFTLSYDQALNSNAGGFHLLSGTASSAVGLSPIFNFVTTGTLAVTVRGTLAQASIAVLNAISAQAVSLQIGSGDFITRMTSTLAASVVFAGAAANAVSQASVNFAAAQPGDNIILGLPSNVPSAVNFVPYVSASGTVVIQAFSPASLVPNTLAIRVSDIGWAS